MNIFKFLGLLEGHRKEIKITQLVKHWDEVVEKHKANKLFGVQIKRDGVCSLTVVKGSEVAIFSRTGRRFTNTENLVRRLKDLELPDGVYMGEIWVSKSVASLEQLSGMVNPNRIKSLDFASSEIVSSLKLSFFDLVSIEDFIKGASDLPFSKRYNRLYLRFNMAKGLGEGMDVLDVVHPTGVEGIVFSLKAATDGGEEGVVIRNLEAGWEAGHKGWRVMKMVRGIDYDLKCIGWEEGTGKYESKVANLIFQWRGKETIKAMLGKGWTHDMAGQMFRDIQRNDTSYDSYHPLGKIFQVYALEESSKGKLRLPKVGEARFDKDKSDV